MPPKDKYSDPKLRDQIKEEIKQSDKGGAPGQWSARKAQMMAQEYKRRDGGYTTDESQQDGSQKQLDKWTEEEWQTREGSGHAEKSDGAQKRYLPKKTWEQMTEEEKKATDEKKQEGSREGKQFVHNTQKAKQSQKKASQEEEQKKGSERRSTRSTAQKATGNTASEAAAAAAAEEGNEKPKANTSQKRKATKQDQLTSTSNAKKQRPNNTKGNEGGNAPPGKVGSKHMDAAEPAPRGSADRLPNKHQQITWRALPGYVDGVVEEILTKGKVVDGKNVKASKDDPKIVLKSNASGKICVHKPNVCFFD